MLRCAVMLFPNPISSVQVTAAFKRAEDKLPPDDRGRQLKAHFFRGERGDMTVVCIVAYRALARDEQGKIYRRISPFGIQAMYEEDVVLAMEVADLPA